ncbi:CsgG/HfaB family protein [Elusimicrobiota bacterium]
MNKTSIPAKTVKFIIAGLFLLNTGCATTSVKQKQALTAETKKVMDMYTGPRRKVAVIEFVNKTKFGERRLGTSAADILITELENTGKFILVEREKLSKIIKEQELALTGLIDSGSAAEVGKIIGVEALITGSISQFGMKTTSSDLIITSGKKQIAEATVDIRLIDVETAGIIYADSGKGVAKSKSGKLLGVGKSAGYDETLAGKSLRAAIVGFVKNIVARISERPWACSIVEVETDAIYLDAGKESGLKIGSKLNVYKLGKSIKNPATGEVIGQKKEKVAEIKVKEHFGNNGAIAELTSGTMPAVKDRCLLE